MFLFFILGYELFSTIGIGLNLKAYDILILVSTIKCLDLSGGKAYHNQLVNKALLPQNVSCFQ